MVKDRPVHREYTKEQLFALLKSAAIAAHNGTKRALEREQSDGITKTKS